MRGVADVLRLERAEHHAVDQRGARDVSAPVTIEDGGLFGSAKLVKRGGDHL